MSPIVVPPGDGSLVPHSGTAPVTAALDGSGWRFAEVAYTISGVVTTVSGGDTYTYTVDVTSYFGWDPNPPYGYTIAFGSGPSGAAAAAAYNESTGEGYTSVVTVETRTGTNPTVTVYSGYILTDLTGGIRVDPGQVYVEFTNIPPQPAGQTSVVPDTVYLLGGQCQVYSSYFPLPQTAWN